MKGRAAAFVIVIRTGCLSFIIPLWSRLESSISVVPGGGKELAHADFCKNLSDIRIIPYKGCEAAVVFVIERERGNATYLIPRK